MDAYPQDEMSSIRENLHAADMLFLVSPIHFSGLSALMTTFISRLQPEWALSQSLSAEKTKESGKKGVLVLTAGSLYPNMFEAAKICAAAVFRTLGFTMAGMLTASQTDSIDINKNFQALERAQALGARLNLNE
jgi:Multimeric flavodoxin WrbA